jgi:glycosyltransferase involved in cell wall biosynthesis
MRIVFAIPGDLSRLTGGYAYDRRVINELPACGVEVAHRTLPASFPDPTSGDIDASIRIINAGLRFSDVILIDGLAYGAIPEDAIRMVSAPVVALCHHPLGLEAGLDRERAQTLFASERCALALAAHVIVTSTHTRETLTRAFSVPASKITVAAPGTDRAARASCSGGAPAMLAVGSIIPRKKFGLLVEALDGVRDLDWRLRIVGDTTHSPQTSMALRNLIEVRGLNGRIELSSGLCDRDVDRIFDTSDVFVSTSLYEGYGMALAEALARGLPVVATTGGASALTVPDAAALKVPPGDIAALRAALRLIIADADLRKQLAEASWVAGQNLPSWRDTANAIALATRSLARGVR